MYQNVTNENGRSKFVGVDNQGNITELYFASKSAQLPIGGGARIAAVSNALTIARQKDVTCQEESCARQFIGNNVKIAYTIEKSDSVAAVALLDEAIRVLGIWRQQHADQGILPAPMTTFAVTGP